MWYSTVLTNMSHLLFYLPYMSHLLFYLPHMPHLLFYLPHLSNLIFYLPHMSRTRICHSASIRLHTLQCYSSHASSILTHAFPMLSCLAFILYLLFSYFTENVSSTTLCHVFSYQAVSSATSQTVWSFRSCSHAIFVTACLIRHPILYFRSCLIFSS
jgi:hypothetical protein